MGGCRVIPSNRNRNNPVQTGLGWFPSQTPTSSPTTLNPSSHLQLPSQPYDYPNYSMATMFNLRLWQLLTPLPGTHPHLQAHPCESHRIWTVPRNSWWRHAQIVPYKSFSLLPNVSRRSCHPCDLFPHLLIRIRRLRGQLGGESTRVGSWLTKLSGISTWISSNRS